jgi:hypothetical protein
MRRVRRTAFFGLALLAILCAAWAGFWHLAANWTEEAITEAMAREARAGRSLSCASREISGFPFSIEMRCENPRLEVERPAGKVVLAGLRVTGVTGVHDFGHVVLAAQGPVSIEAPNISGAEAQWGSLTASLVLGARGFDHVDVAVETPSFRLRDGQNMIASTAERLELHARRDPLRPEPEDAVEVTGKLSHLASPVLDALSGEASPAEAEIEASVSRASAAFQPGSQPGSEEPPPPALERWRMAGGAMHIARADIRKGPVRIGLAGDLSLDEAHRLTGHIDAALEGADALAQRLQIPKIGINLARMSGGKLRLPAELANGRVTAALGPVGVTLPVRLMPLY